MMRHSSVLLIILVVYSEYSFGVMVPYENNTMIHFSAKENITITCSGTDEVTWKNTVSMNVYGDYTIKVETPRRKLLQIINATVYNSGMYECVSAKNSDEFIQLFLIPDGSFFPDNRAVSIISLRRKPQSSP